MVVTINGTDVMDGGCSAINLTQLNAAVVSCQLTIQSCGSRHIFVNTTADLVNIPAITCGAPTAVCISPSTPAP